MMFGVSKLTSVVLAVSALVCPLPAMAEFGAFDRAQEIQTYISIFRTGSEQEAARAAHELYYAGITDARLELALSDRLAQTYQGLALRHSDDAPPFVNQVLRKIPNADVHYGVNLVEALASLGIDDAAALLQQIANSPKIGGSEIKQVRKVARREEGRIAWYRERNEIMSSKRNHRDGDNPRVSMLINLLLAQDASFRNHAIDQIQREKLNDPRLYRVLRMKVEDYLMEPPAAPNRDEERFVAHTVRVLAQTGDHSYAEILDKVAKSKLPNSIKKEAKFAPVQGARR